MTETLLSTWEVGRFTGNLRAYSGVANALVEDTNFEVRQAKFKDLESRKFRKYNKEGFTRWRELYAYIKQKGSRDQLMSLMLISYNTQSIFGKICVGEAMATAIEECFTIFETFENDSDFREMKILHDKFGHFDDSLMKQIYEEYIVLKDTFPQFFDNNTDIPDLEMFGAKIKFHPPEIPDFNYTSSSSDDESEPEVLPPPTQKHASFKSKAKTTTPESSSWLVVKCKELYKGASPPPPLPLAELVDTLYDLVRTHQPDELQESLIGLLGLDAIEFIIEIISNKNKIQKPNGFDWISDDGDSEEDFDIFAGKFETTSVPHFKREKGPTVAAQVNIFTEREKIWRKQLRKEEKKLKKEISQSQNKSLDPEYLRQQREYALLTAATTPQLLPRIQSAPELPYVFDTRMGIKQTAAYILGVKISLPADAISKSEPGKEEYTIPATKSIPPSSTDFRINIADLDNIGQLAFKGIKQLNRIQSVVFDKAYNSNQNLLISAPTGAGKTNVALLTIVRLIKSYTENGVVNRKKFKVVYVTPMKALAAEMTKTFGKKLKPLGVEVRELTGDMQLTKTVIANTQMLVVTPEKWDVITRKSTGDTALSNLVRLLIIDEVHLLHEDRGSVIETLVARTLRQVETNQQMIRIVGLSATLPNYIDVARFLRVNLNQGLFYFDGRFRPVPLQQTFVGVRGTNNFKIRENTEQICYEKVIESIKDDNQVLVFVHTRNGTIKTAERLIQIGQTEGELSLFSCVYHPKYDWGLKQLSRSSQKKLNFLYQHGISVHHAGLPRGDRNVIEQMFNEGVIKVLVCTATLAWGVNLPAHTVVIKGTEYYDASKGQFDDIGILDVLQIFGRAGRPQFDTSGHGIIITPQDKLSKYLQLLTQQQPIESQFTHSLEDNLNAEICLGTVSTIEDAISWLKYTFFWIRVQKNPMMYGVSYKMRENDPDLYHYLTDIIKKSALRLDQCRMIRYNMKTGQLTATDLGRTASYFYIRHPTIEHFNETFKPNLVEDEILKCVSQADEFAQIEVQDEDSVELTDLMQQSRINVLGGSENVYGKVSILLQAYISQLQIQSYSLLSDSLYVAQNGSRIIRAMFDIAIHNGFPAVADKLLALSKMLTHKIWEEDTPLRQFSILTNSTLEKLERQHLSIDKLREMPAKEIGQMIKHVSMGDKIKACVSQLPHVGLEVQVQPVTSTVIKLSLTITPQFEWNDRVHGKVSVPWWIWVEDTNNDHMYHSEYFNLQKKHVISNEPQTLVFSIPLIDRENMMYIVKMISDNWIGCETAEAVSVKGVILPEEHLPHTRLLDLQPLPTAVLKNPLYENYFSFTHFNPIQTQTFHSLFHTDENVLVGAPTGSGKTVAAELAMFRVFEKYPGNKCVYIAPLKALVKERTKDWVKRIGTGLGKTVVELTGDVVPDMKAVVKADVIVTTPEKWDGISRSWQVRKYVQSVRLLVIDEIHLLGNDRGPVLEVIVSRTNFISSHTEQTVRVVGLSTALANAGDVGNWLNVTNIGMFNFKPSVRPVPLEVHITGFPGQHYCPRMATMNKPAYNDIRQYSPEKPVLIFVASRRQTRLTAFDLISHVVAENPKTWVHLPEEDLQIILQDIDDDNLKHALQFGIGLHHAGLHENDRKTVEDLFANRKIQILVATATLAWGVNLPAHLVIIKGTEYYDGKINRYVDFPITDVLQMMGRAGRPQFDDQGMACIYVHDIKKHFYKKFLYEPFPVESNLLSVLTDHFNAEIVAGTIKSKQDAMDYLTWTYFFRRLLRNPAYYNLEDLEEDNINTFLSHVVTAKIEELEQSYCVKVDTDLVTLVPQVLGCIASYYYLSHKTVRLFFDTLKPSSSLNDILQLLCDVTEYDEMPVRHNEDKLNEELATTLPIRVPAYSYDSPHTKVHLLLQSHFSRQPMPITDYVTDLKSVHDQAIRILQAMLDMCTDCGWLRVALNIMHLIKMVMQGCWLKDDPLLQLPHIEPYQVPKFYQNRFWDKEVAFPEMLLHYTEPVLKRLLVEEMSARNIADIARAIRNYPLLKVEYKVAGDKLFGDDYVPEVSPCGNQWEPVHADHEYSLEIKLQIRTPGRQKEPGKGGVRKAICPRFTKPVDETWWIVLGEVDSGELIAMKRLSAPRGNTITTSVAFYTPEVKGRHIYTLYVISQTYFGLDQQYDIYLDVLDPDIVYQMDKQCISFNSNEDFDFEEFHRESNSTEDVMTAEWGDTNWT